MSLETLMLLRSILARQSLDVGAEGFRGLAPQVVAALDELDAAITQAQDATRT